MKTKPNATPAPVIGLKLTASDGKRVITVVSLVYDGFAVHHQSYAAPALPVTEVGIHREWLERVPETYETMSIKEWYGRLRLSVENGATVSWPNAVCN
jgi:hypothetical protein